MAKSTFKAEKQKLRLDLENSVNQEMTFKPKHQKVRLAFLSTQLQKIEIEFGSRKIC